MKTNATGLLLTWLSSVFAPTQKQHKSLRRGKINTGTTRIKRYFPVVGRQVSFGPRPVDSLEGFVHAYRHAWSLGNGALFP
jgi:hypothetical protein